MSRLFAELYLDEDVDVLVAQLLRARGFSATTTVEAGQLHASDTTQLAYAATNQLAFVTHNREDFKSLHGQYSTSGRQHSGVIVAVRRPPHAIATRLLAILNHVTADELENQIVFI